VAFRGLLASQRLRGSPERPPGRPEEPRESAVQKGLVVRGALVVQSELLGRREVGLPGTLEGRVSRVSPFGSTTCVRLLYRV